MLLHPFHATRCASLFSTIQTDTIKIKISRLNKIQVHYLEWKLLTQRFAMEKNPFTSKCFREVIRFGSFLSLHKTSGDSVAEAEGLDFIASFTYYCDFLTFSLWMEPFSSKFTFFANSHQFALFISDHTTTAVPLVMVVRTFFRQKNVP